MKKIIPVLFLVLLGLICAGTAAITALRCVRDPSGVPFGRDALSKSVADNVLLHDGWIELHGAFLRATGVDVLRESDGKTLARLQDGSLSFIHRAEPAFDDAQTASIAALHDAAASSGAECWFVCIPQKVCPEQSRFASRGVADETTQTDEERMRSFSDAGYSVLDLHARMHAEGLSHPGLYYRSDHHWTAEAGLWAAGEVARVLGIDDSALQKENFTSEKHPGVFLGSEGRLFGTLYCRSDDLDIPIPKGETALTYRRNDEAVRTGTFSDALLFRERMAGNPFKIFPYSVFLDGDSAFQSIRNEHLPQGKRVLLVKDSFSLSLASYLSLVCAEVDQIDVRQYTQSVSALASSGSYDAVLVTMSGKLDNSYFVFQ